MPYLFQGTNISHRDKVEGNPDQLATYVSVQTWKLSNSDTDQLAMRLEVFLYRDKFNKDKKIS